MDALARIEYLTMQELHVLIETRRDVLAIDEWWKRYGCHHPVYCPDGIHSLHYTEPKKTVDSGA